MTRGFNHIPNFIDSLKNNVIDALDDSAGMIEGEIKMSMRDGKHGRSYKVSKSGKPHTASAPGEPPAIDTGALVNSITTESPSEYVREVGTAMEYAQHLEFGTPGGKIAPRPFIRPAFTKLYEKVINRLNQALNNAGKQ